MANMTNPLSAMWEYVVEVIFKDGTTMTLTADSSYEWDTITEDNITLWILGKESDERNITGLGGIINMTNVNGIKVTKKVKGI